MAKKNGQDEEYSSIGNVSARVEKGQLIITADLTKPTPSASGKTQIVASTHGPLHTSCMAAGKPVTISLNAYIPNK